jgi:hypothetical protein
MEINNVFTLFLGLVLTIFPILIGARYLGKWRTDEHRLKRRMRELEF